MRQFKVIVNGREYFVEVDEVHEPNMGRSAAEEKDVDKSIQAKVSVGGSQPQDSWLSVSSDSKTITAPLAGVILSVRVKAGDYVKAGDILLTLEALKLENEIVTPYSGVVRSVTATVGQEVDTSEILVVME
jgi:biotin carboxyl carrier protein